MVDVIIALILLAVPTAALTVAVVMLVRAWARHRILREGLQGIARVESQDYRSHTFISDRSIYRLILTVVPENGAPPFAARVRWSEPTPGLFFSSQLRTISQPLLVRYRAGRAPLVVLDEPGMMAAGLLPKEGRSMLGVMGRIAFVIFMALLAGSGLVAGIVTMAGRDRASGRIEAEGAQFSAWTLEAKKCRNGVHEGFFGVMVQNADGELWIRLLRDPEGEPSMLAHIPGTDRTLRISRQNCTRLDADIHETGTVYNNVRGLGGSLTLSCVVGESTLKGHIEFDQCS